MCSSRSFHVTERIARHFLTRRFHLRDDGVQARALGQEDGDVANQRKGARPDGSAAALHQLHIHPQHPAVALPGVLPLHGRLHQAGDGQGHGVGRGVRHPTLVPDDLAGLSLRACAPASGVPLHAVVHPGDRGAGPVRRTGPEEAEPRALQVAGDLPTPELKTHDGEQFSWDCQNTSRLAPHARRCLEETRIDRPRLD